MDGNEVGRVTAILSHVAGVLEQLNLEEYELVLRERGANTWASAPEPVDPESREIALRYAALRVAARAAGRVVDEVNRALAHQRAALIAAREQQRPTVRVFSDRTAAAARLAYPDSNVVAINRREEALPDESA